MGTPKVKIGIIGMGIMGSMYARLVTENAEAELVALCDIDPGRRTEIEARFGVNAYTDSTSLLDQESLDAVLITTPDHLHLQPVIQVAERNLHMMVEKPLALELNQAMEMKEAAKNANKVAMMAHVFRWYAPIAQISAFSHPGKYFLMKLINERT